MQETNETVNYTIDTNALSSNEIDALYAMAFNGGVDNTSFNEENKTEQN